MKLSSRKWLDKEDIVNLTRGKRSGLDETWDITNPTTYIPIYKYNKGYPTKQRRVKNEHQHHATGTSAWNEGVVRFKVRNLRTFSFGRNSHHRNPRARTERNAEHRPRTPDRGAELHCWHIDAHETAAIASHMMNTFAQTTAFCALCGASKPIGTPKQVAIDIGMTAAESASTMPAAHTHASPAPALHTLVVQGEVISRVARSEVCGAGGDASDIGSFAAVTTDPVTPACIRVVDPSTSFGRV